MSRSAIILSNDSQAKFNEDKYSSLKLNGEPLLNHIVEALKGVVTEVIVVLNSNDQKDSFAKNLPSYVRFLVNIDSSKGLLAGALTGFEASQGKHSLLLPINMPFVSKEVVSLLFELCIGKAAAIPRWPNQEIEPLQAVYDTKQALEAAKQALANDENDVSAIASSLRGVRFVSTLVIEQIDPEFRSFIRVNSPLDLKKASTPKKRIKS